MRLKGAAGPGGTDPPPAMDAAAWVAFLRAHGWAATDSPRGVVAGAAHPSHGMLRLPVTVCAAATLTALATHAAGDAGGDAPRLFVGLGVFTDVLRGRERGVLGVLRWRDAHAGDHVASMSLARAGDLWLPYWEDADGWAFTGWEPDGRAFLEVPGCHAPLLPSRAAEATGSCDATLDTRHSAA